MGVTAEVPTHRAPQHSAKRKRTATHRSPVRFAARMLLGARPGPFPGFIAPCNPTLKSVVPTGERWLCEIKHDGYRIHAHQAEWKAALTAATPMVIFISFPRK